MCRGLFCITCALQQAIFASDGCPKLGRRLELLLSRFEGEEKLTELYRELARTLPACGNTVAVRINSILSVNCVIDLTPMIMR